MTGRAHSRWMHGPDHNLRLLFREQTLSLSTFQPTLTTTISTASQSLALIGCPGSDFAHFLYVLGDRVLSLFDKLAIRSRLMTISRHVQRPMGMQDIAKESRAQMRVDCDDLLELCSPKYAPKLRRKALNLLVVLLKHIDARSLFLLESNFIELLVSFDLERSTDAGARKVFNEILGIFKDYHQLPCKCLACIGNFRSKLRIWDAQTTALYALFEDRKNHQTRV